MTKKTKKRSKVRIYKLPKLERDVPANAGLVNDVRNELLSEMWAGFAKIDSRFKKQDAKFKDIDARFDRIDARFDRMESRFKGFEAAVFRVQALVEEMRAENKVTLEGLRLLFDRQDRVENRMDKTEELIRDIARLNREKYS